MMPGNKVHIKHVEKAGKDIGEAEKAMIMIHGRGGNAEDILSLASYFPVGDFALLAPQATNNTWYPYSFLASPDQNEPWLSSALQLVGEVVEEVVQAGIKKEHIYLLGFSQGACLALEFAARKAARYGGVIAFSGGLIGDKIQREKYAGDFEGTQVFLGSSDPDFHVPVERVYATTHILKEMHARVKEKIYPGMGHTIIPDEIARAREWVMERPAGERHPDNGTR